MSANTSNTGKTSNIDNTANTVIKANTVITANAVFFFIFFIQVQTDIQAIVYPARALFMFNL